MTTTTPNMSMILPDDHGSAELWGGLVSAALTLNDGHDHSTGKGVKVPTAGLNINADLSFSPSGTPRAITDLKAVDFAPVASTAVNSLAGAFFISDGTGGLVSGELYFRTTAGTNIRVTNGAALNVAAFAGGIGGDYSAVGAAVAFDDAADRYTFKQQSNLWARMASGEVRILETGTTEAFYVGLACPAALAASYSITLPLAAPGSTQIMQMDSAGVLTASNTIGNTLTIPATVAGASNFTGALTMASTLGVTGLVTATAGITAAANQSVTVSGTGQFKHGTRERHIDISAYQPNGATTYIAFNGAGYLTGISATADICTPVPLDVGKRLLTYQQTYDIAGTGATITFAIKRINVATGAVTTVASGTDGSGTGIETIAVNSINHTIAVGFAYFIAVTLTNASHRLYSGYISYDEP